MGYAFQEVGINFIKAESILRNGTIAPDTFSHIDEKTHNALKRSIIEESDVLVTIAGIYLGKIGLVQKEHLPANTNQAVAIVRPDSKKMVPAFLKYFLLVDSTTKYLNALCPQSAQPNLNLTQLGNLKFPLPPLPIQRKIAAVLSAYDDLIENNTRRIAILEKMAEELYREWFVRLRFPGHEKTKIVKGVPEGWKHVELIEIAFINQQNIGKGFPHEWIDYLDISAVSTNTISKPDRMKFSEAPSRARRLVKHGDIIWSTVRPANRAFAVVLHPQNNLVVSTGFVVLTPRGNIPFSFLHRITTTNEFVDQMVSVAKGAAYPATSSEDFGKAKVWLPPQTLLDHFARVCDSIYLKAHYQRKQSELLSEARNSLLSRLMSGKIDLEHLEHLDIHFPPSMREEELVHA